MREGGEERRGRGRGRGEERERRGEERRGEVGGRELGQDRWRHSLISEFMSLEERLLTVFLPLVPLLD